MATSRGAPASAIVPWRQVFDKLPHAVQTEVARLTLPHPVSCNLKGNFDSYWNRFAGPSISRIVGILEAGRHGLFHPGDIFTIMEVGGGSRNVMTCCGLTKDAETFYGHRVYSQLGCTRRFDSAGFEVWSSGNAVLPVSRAAWDFLVQHEMHVKREWEKHGRNETDLLRSLRAKSWKKPRTLLAAEQDSEETFVEFEWPKAAFEPSAVRKATRRLRIHDPETYARVHGACAKGPMRTGEEILFFPLFAEAIDPDASIASQHALKACLQDVDDHTRKTMRT